MIELHLHLDGSLSKEDFVYLSKTQHIPLGKNFPYNISVSDDCKSLEEYLECFDTPLSMLQIPSALEYVAESLAKRLYNLGYIYAEVRYAPLLHTRNGMKQSEAVEAVLKGFNNFISTHKDFDIGVILCCMRNASDTENKLTIETALKYRNEGVVGLDLAGSERARPLKHFKEMFQVAVDANFPFTIHAGEALDGSEVIEAIEMGASRIGHGVHLKFDIEIIKYLMSKNVTFEFCPTSNIQTTSLKNYEECPIKNYLTYGLKACLNSDNMTVSDTNIVKEYIHAVRHNGLTKTEVWQCLYNAVMASFAPLNKKMEILKTINENFNKFYSRVA